MLRLLRNPIRLLALLATLWLSACDFTDTASLGPIQPADVIVLNEGQFLAGNADFSVYSPGEGTVQNGAFAAANGRALGDVLQSATQVDDRLYLVVNNSNKIEVVDAQTGASLATIGGLALPRFLVQVDARTAYVSEWVGFGVTGRLSILDLETNTVTGTIALPYVQPERMVLVDGKVLVATNSFSGEQGLLVVDVATETVDGEIPLDGTPNSLVVEADGDAWALTADYINPVTFLPLGSGAAELVRINAPNLSVAETLALPAADATTGQLQLLPAGEGFALLYNSTVARYRFGTGSLTTWVNADFYGIGVAPDGNLYTADAGNFVSAGTLRVYAADGSLLDTETVGVAPNGFVFLE